MRKDVDKMNEIIIKALDEAGIQNFYITRLNEKTNDVYAVFTHFSDPVEYADNKKGGEEYNILVNLYCKRSIEKNKNTVIDALNKAGLKGGSCQGTIREETGYYNTAITFKYFLSK